MGKKQRAAAAAAPAPGPEEAESSTAPAAEPRLPVEVIYCGGWCFLVASFYSKMPMNDLKSCSMRLAPGILRVWVDFHAMQGMAGGGAL
jgi:hypothetical protein